MAIDCERHRRCADFRPPLRLFRRPFGRSLPRQHGDRFGHLPPSVGGGSQGTFTIVWESVGQDGDDGGIYGQRYATSGAPVGDEFRIDAYTTGPEEDARVAMGSNGAFIVMWRSTGQFAGSNIFARSFCGLQGDATGNDAIGVADVFFLINALFAGGPGAVHQSDVNGDGVVNVGDVFYLINYLFASGPAPGCID